MAKFYGTVGFAETKETDPGVWEDSIIKRNYYGDIISTYGKNVSSQQLNDDVIMANVISILADPYANENFSMIRYVEYMGVKWKVSNVEVKFPRLILTTGGVYNGYDE